jgi:hypothetical protein
MLVFKKIPDELDQFEADLVVAVVGSDEKPLRSTNAWLDWRLYGSLTDLMAKGLFKGELGEKCLLPTYGRFKFDRLILLGADEIFDVHSLPSDEEGSRRWMKIAQILEATVGALNVGRVGLSLPRYEVAEHERALMRILQSTQWPKNTSLFLSRATSPMTPVIL